MNGSRMKMSERNFNNFLQGYIEYTSHLEAPTEFHLWAGIATIAGALRGKCWIDMGFFKWKPNCFIIFVAPPGVAAKSTTLDQGMNLLKQVDGINFAPASATWQALCSNFAEVQETFNVNGKDIQMSNLTIAASELGTFLDMQNREMIDMLVDMWDGKDSPWVRRTKGGGEEVVQAPWVNLAACTTPSWVMENMPQYAIGGGFTSRCIFLYADKKEKAVAYPHSHIPKHHTITKTKLVEDLKRIASIKGAFTIEQAALDFGTRWYEEHTLNTPRHLRDARLQGYAARKQSHIHKIAMCLSAAERDDRVITLQHFQAALSLLGIIEQNMMKVFDSISDDHDAKALANLKAKLVEHYKAGAKSGVDRNTLYCELSSRMSLTSFETACQAVVRAGFAQDIVSANGRVLKPIMDKIEGSYYTANAAERSVYDELKKGEKIKGA